MPKEFVISIVKHDSPVCDDTMDLFNSMNFIAETLQRAGRVLKFSRHHSESCLIANVQMAGNTWLDLKNLGRNRDNPDCRNHPGTPFANSLRPPETALHFSFGGGI